MEMHLQGYGHVVEEVTVAALIRAKLVDHGWTQVAAAARLGCSAKHVNEIVQGKIAVSPELAIGLEMMLGESGLAERILVAQVQEDLRKRGFTTQT